MPILVTHNSTSASRGSKTRTFDLGMMSLAFTTCVTAVVKNMPMIKTHNSLLVAAVRSRTQALDCGMMTQVLYHCATAYGQNMLKLRALN